MRYEVIDGPGVGLEAVSLTDARAHLRVLAGDTSEDETIIKPAIVAARLYCENVTGRALARQRLRAYPTDWLEARWPLPMPPLAAIEDITWWDADGAEHSLPATDYALNAAWQRLYLRADPVGRLRAYAPIEITYTAGYDTPPEPLRQAMLLLIAHWYVNREAVAVGAVASAEIDLGVRRLCNQYRAWWY